MAPDDLSARFASQPLLDWLREAAWPLWIAHGIDWDRRGFQEHLRPKDLRCTANFRRLRVVARQVYSFAQAASFGVARADEAVELGMSYLRNTASQDGHGYARCFSLDGHVIDRTRDLYDHAFVLLAFASAAPLLGKDAVRGEATALLELLDAKFSHPDGGYLEALPPVLPRRQNPHMHLLEACLAAAEAFEDEIYLVRAGKLVRLFLDRLLDPHTGTLPEFFDDALAPIQDTGRHVVEPGHHCEWAWLLDWYRRAARAPAGDLAQAGKALIAFVDRHGLHSMLGTVCDEVWSDGSPKSLGCRLWPQTERLKAEALRPDATPAGMARAHAALARYLLPSPRGLWIERLSAEGAALSEAAPASSLYHLTCGILVAHRHLSLADGAP